MVLCTCSIVSNKICCLDIREIASLILLQCSVDDFFSASVAGDFAVLLRAGMSVKQAVVYNCVSSILCFIGMLVGVAIGNIHNASLWVFAGVGGMFLYISMVDMVSHVPVHLYGQYCESRSCTSLWSIW